jgi:hypothetical protein
VNVRPFVDDDAPAVAALISAEEERLYVDTCGVAFEKTLE